MAFQRFPLNASKRHDPVSTEVRLRTLLADIELLTLTSPCKCCSEASRLAAQGRDVR